MRNIAYTVLYIAYYLLIIYCSYILYIWDHICAQPELQTPWAALACLGDRRAASVFGAHEEEESGGGAGEVRSASRACRPGKCFRFQYKSAGRKSTGEFQARKLHISRFLRRRPEISLLKVKFLGEEQATAQCKPCSPVMHAPEEWGSFRDKGGSVMRKRVLQRGNRTLIVGRAAVTKGRVSAKTKSAQMWGHHFSTEIQGAPWAFAWLALFPHFRFFFF